MTLAGLRVCFVTPEYPPHIGGVAHSAHRIVSGLPPALRSSRRPSMARRIC
jgi:hypothetical protein